MIDWWSRQDKEVFDLNVKPKSYDVPLHEGVKQIVNFCYTTKGYNPKKSYIWSRGTDFDIPIIKSIFLMCDTPIPYQFWKVRDIRTAIDILAGVDDGKYTIQGDASGFKAHDCLHDAAMDATRLTELFTLNS